jgi:hypothetical protein
VVKVMLIQNLRVFFFQWNKFIQQMYLLNLTVVYKIINFISLIILVYITYFIIIIIIIIFFFFYYYYLYYYYYWECSFILHNWSLCVKKLHWYIRGANKTIRGANKTQLLYFLYESMKNYTVIYQYSFQMLIESVHNSYNTWNE